MATRETPNRRRARASLLVVLDVLLLLIVLATAVHTMVVSRLRTLGPITQSMHDFWQQRANELCGERSKIPAAPQFAADANPMEHLTMLAQLTEFRQQVWQSYQDCQEPVTRTINEDLLHFKVNQPSDQSLFNLNSDEDFDSDPRSGFAKIRAYVDENIGNRNQIYIIGHTDDTFTDEYNYKLSYRRALEIAVLIRQHLQAQGKKPGRDYTLYPLGMGKSQLLEQPVKRPTEAEVAAWRTRCRRIELSFRSMPGRGRAR